MAGEKCTERVTVHMTQTEYLDFMRLCDLAGRSPSEYVRIVLMRPHMYGILRRVEADSEFAMSGPAPL